MANYTVIRTDLMSGTKQPADLVSVRVYNAAGTETIAVENGAIVELSALEDGEREVWIGKLATASTTDLSKCVVIATPEVFYDERKKNLDEFVNEAGTIARGYRLNQNDIFSITKEGFVSATAPDAVGVVKLGAGGKLEPSTGSGHALGNLIAIEETTRYKYYVLQVGEIN